MDATRYRRLSSERGMLGMHFAQEAISLPLYPGLSEFAQDRVVAALAQALA